MRRGLVFCLLTGLGAFFPLEAKPVAGHVVGWNYTASVPNDLPANLTNIVAISSCAAGNYYCLNLALRENGTVVAWGRNSLGQTLASVPAGVQNVAGIAAGGDHYLALKGDGTVYAWQSTALLSVPAYVTNVAAIAAGPGGYSLALTKAGGVLSWTHGSGNYVLPSGLDSNVQAIAGGPAFFAALKSNGVVVAWGLNNLGQTNVPAGTTNFAAVAVDYIHGVGFNTNGTVAAWGASWSGSGQATVPAGLSNMVAVAAGGVKGSHSLVLKSDGTVSTWGEAQTAIPGNVSNVVAIAAGDYYNLAIVADWKISAMNVTNQKPAIRFYSFAGQHYVVEYATNLPPGNWAPLTQTNLGTGGDMIIVDTNAPGPGRFYRVKQW
ncbi:MAG: hypothetical protein P4N60_23675 [Verrucomicrobiae bacterium]|nr:hypothetical protein [Verrucomicrobiae bacterium]